MGNRERFELSRTNYLIILPDFGSINKRPLFPSGQKSQAVRIIKCTMFVRCQVPAFQLRKEEL